MPLEVDRLRVQLIARGSITEIRPEAGGESAFVRPNSRDEGFWQVYRGPNPEAATEPLSGGYASKDEAIAAATEWIVTGNRLAPQGEGWVRLDDASPWKVAAGEGELFGPEPWGPGILVTLMRLDTGDPAACLMTPDEYDSVRGAIQAGSFPRVAVPERRLLTGLEAQAMLANPPQPVTVDGESAGAQPGAQPASLLGRWVEITMPEDTHPSKEPVSLIGFVYFDSDTGLSAQGWREDRTGVLPEGNVGIRLPTEWPIRILTPDEIDDRALPAQPGWLRNYREQPDPAAAWRSDPAVTAKVHPSFPDDIQALVHDREICWVRLASTAGEQDAPRLNSNGSATIGRRTPIYTGVLLNQPVSGPSPRAGESIHLMADTGSKVAVIVTERYRAERPDWEVQPCDRCGFAELLSLPSEASEGPLPDQLRRMPCGQCDGQQAVRRRRAS